SFITRSIKFVVLAIPGIEEIKKIDYRLLRKIQSILRCISRCYKFFKPAGDSQFCKIFFYRNFIEQNVSRRMILIGNFFRKRVNVSPDLLCNWLNGLENISE